MRMVLLLIVLAAIGLTLARWLEHSPSAPKGSDLSAMDAKSPHVPTRPQDVKAFESDINRFIKESAVQRAKQEPPP